MEVLYQAEALGDYEAEDGSEISLKKGAKYSVHQVNEHGWWECSDPDGNKGWAPSTYLKELQEEGSEDEESEDVIEDCDMQAVALGDYEAEEGCDPPELDLVEENSSGWWHAINGDGNNGWVPSNYLRVLESAAPPETPELPVAALPVVNTVVPAVANLNLDPPGGPPSVDFDHLDKQMKTGIEVSDESEIELSDPSDEEPAPVVRKKKVVFGKKKSNGAGKKFTVPKKSESSGFKKKTFGKKKFGAKKTPVKSKPESDSDSDSSDGGYAKRKTVKKSVKGSRFQSKFKKAKRTVVKEEDEKSVSVSSKKTVAKRSKKESMSALKSLQLKSVGAKCCWCKKTTKDWVKTHDDKYYCFDCFKCFECKKKLKDTEYQVRDGKYYCKPCFDGKFCHHCTKCKEPIMEEILTTGHDTHFHPDCFVCGKCDGPFSDGLYSVVDDIPHCSKCSVGKVIKIPPVKAAFNCVKCKKGIHARVVTAFNKRYHVKCFLCYRDDKPVPYGDKWKKVNGHVYCSAHIPKKKKWKKR